MPIYFVYFKSLFVKLREEDAGEAYDSFAEGFLRNKVPNPAANER